MFLKTMGGSFLNKYPKKPVRTFSNDYGSNWSELSDKRKRMDNFTCKLCGWYAGPKERNKLHVHHKVPLSKGGRNVLSNLITLCQDCHSKIHGGKKLWRN